MSRPTESSIIYVPGADETVDANNNIPKVPAENVFIDLTEEDDDQPATKKVVLGGSAAGGSVAVTAAYVQQIDYDQPTSEFSFVVQFSLDFF
jgi:hypothetical protein